ncbi:hypothetical protein HMPREF9062_2403 [Actinomyces sp. oral taxon 448 str. F0400]|nr:hypothetical protein HMPREF9062_2403 [Actinomyces sp. oral taxon 448 str. F0400]
MACAALVVGLVGLAGCGLISRMSGSSSDPMDGVLTAMGGGQPAGGGGVFDAPWWERG